MANSTIDALEAAPVLSARADLLTSTAAIRWQVLVLALPVLGEQVLNAGVGYVDTYLAGQISKEATSAVGFASYASWLVTNLFMLVGTGATALVSRHVGARQPQTANRFANQAVLMGVAFGLVGSAGLYAAAPTLAWLQGFGGEALDIAIAYLRIDSSSYLLYSVLLAGAAALRGAGDMKTTMWIMLGVNLVNIFVSAGLVFGWGVFPQVGTNGIAIGTVVGRMLGGLAMTAVLLRGRGPLRLKAAYLSPRWDDLKRLSWVGVPAAIDGAVLWVGHFLFLMIVNRIGEGSVQTANYAAHMVGVKVESFSFLPAQAWGAAAATLVGQGMGARRLEDSRRSGNEAARQVLVLMLIMGTIYFAFASPLFAFFTEDVRVRALGVGPLRLLALFQPALGVLIVYMFALRGAGDTRFPLLYSFLSVWGVRLPLAYLLVFWTGWGLLGAWIGMACDLTVRAVLMSWRFWRGQWQNIQV